MTHSEKILSIASKADKKKIADFKAKKESAKKVLSDDDLLNDLSDLNIASLVAKTATNRNIWKLSFKSEYSDNEKTARRKIRTTQLKLSKSILHSILTKAERNVQILKAKELKDFYSKGLENFEIFTNVSQTESPDKYALITKAYQKMNLLVKLAILNNEKE